ncbi:efflux RND transporter periplasmic adaptor subunit [Paraburkholderia azotifigens]|uniref:efflux RND transporter periplasmic adaptor subunit n=1 Tax=Paraburkholderia azotifigens TaxID=2057004 RepID=UPI00316C8814
MSDTAAGNARRAVGSAADSPAPAQAREGDPAMRLRRWCRRPAAWAAAAAFIALASVAGWLFSHRAPTVYYTTVALGAGNVERTVTATGTVNPVLTIIVGSYVSGVIQDQYCDFNTQVHKGQLCAKIDPRPYQTQVNQARPDLANAHAQLVKDTANLAYAKLAFHRDGALLERGIVSQDVYDNAQSAYDQARAQIEVDRATIQQKHAALDAAQVNLDYTNIVSPVDGTVVSRNITIGQTVAASFQTPTLFLIATDLTQMEVDVNVSESDVGGLREGDKASFTVEAYPGQPFDGHVVQVRQAPQTVQNIVTYDIVVGVDNKALRLRPGMTATTRIVTAEREHVLRVPDQALRFTPRLAASGTDASGAAADTTVARSASRATQTLVWVLKDGKPTAVAITTGLDDDSYSEVTGGALHAGDLVIVGEQRAGGGRVSTAPLAPHLHS